MEDEIRNEFKNIRMDEEVVEKLVKFPSHQNLHLIRSRLEQESKNMNEMSVELSERSSGYKKSRELLLRMVSKAQGSSSTSSSREDIVILQSTIEDWNNKYKYYDRGLETIRAVLGERERINKERKTFFEQCSDIENEMKECQNVIKGEVIRLQRIRTQQIRDLDEVDRISEDLKQLTEFGMNLQTKLVDAILLSVFDFDVSHLLSYVKNIQSSFESFSIERNKDENNDEESEGEETVEEPELTEAKLTLEKKRHELKIKITNISKSVDYLLPQMKDTFQKIIPRYEELRKIIEIYRGNVLLTIEQQEKVKVIVEKHGIILEDFKRGYPRGWKSTESFILLKDFRDQLNVVKFSLRNVHGLEKLLKDCIESCSRRIRKLYQSISIEETKKIMLKSLETGLSNTIKMFEEDMARINRVFGMKEFGIITKEEKLSDEVSIPYVAYIGETIGMEKLKEAIEEEEEEEERISKDNIGIMKEISTTGLCISHFPYFAGKKHGVGYKFDKEGEKNIGVFNMGSELSPSPSVINEIMIRGEEIGEGGCGKVYLCDFLGEPAAFKCYQLPESMENSSLSFFKRRKIIMKMTHPNIAKIFGVEMKDQKMAVIRRFYSNKYEVEKISLLPLTLKLKYLYQICDALAYFHQMGFIHRDISACNILLDGKCDQLGTKAIVIDLDLAGQKGASFFGVRFEKLTKFEGKDNWKAPEFHRGDRRYGESVDVYSFGILMFCSLVGILNYDENPFLHRCVTITRENDFKIPKFNPDVHSKVFGPGPSNPCYSELVSLTYKCLKIRENKRPSMKNVSLQILKLLKNLQTVKSTSITSGEKVVLKEEEDSKKDVVEVSKASMKKKEKKMKERKKEVKKKIIVKKKRVVKKKKVPKKKRVKKKKKEGKKKESISQEELDMYRDYNFGI